MANSTILRQFCITLMWLSDAMQIQTHFPMDLRKCGVKRTSRKQWSILSPDGITKMCRHVCGLQKKDTHKELNICTTCSQVSLSTHHCLRCSVITINIEKLSAWLETGWFIFFGYVDNLADLGETNYIWHERIGIWKKQKEKKFFE